jgi:tetratricopeptide (TPR) repeat protein
MSESPDTVLEITKMIIGFLSDNSISIVVIVLLLICRDAISNFISRLMSLTFKNGDVELGLKAESPTNESKDRQTEIPNADEKPLIKDEETEIKKKVEESDWLSEMRQAFQDGKLGDAETAFKKYAFEEKDEAKLEENKAFYLFLRFEKGKDNSAINELEELARIAKTEDLKFNSLMWLSFCLSDGMQHKKEITLWQSAVKEMISPELVTKAVVQLAFALKKEEKFSEARKILIKQLALVKDDLLKSSIFEALSIIEDSLGSKVISIYCKDKAVEYDPNNRDELFNSAYSASDEGIDEVSISNYLQLIRIDSDNATALNNLAVRAQEAGMKIEAIENYKKSSELNNTLAMANQGYLFLGAGFIEEAEKIAQKALELDGTHQNVYNLITEINKQKTEQKTKWEKLCKKSLKRQRMIRSYTESYYLADSKKLHGNWYTNESIAVNVLAKDGELEAEWQEVSGDTQYTVKLTGKVNGATFSGKYTKKNNGASPNLFLSLNSDNTCIGYISEEGDRIIVFSPKLKDDFSLILLNKKA